VRETEPRAEGENTPTPDGLVQSVCIDWIMRLWISLIRYDIPASSLLFFLAQFDCVGRILSF